MSKASLNQGKQILNLFSKSTEEEVQRIIEAGDLLKMMMKVDITEVDREKFQKALMARLSIFGPFSTVTVPATTAAEPFNAKNSFVVDTSDNAPVKISGTGSNFNNWFLVGNGNIKDPISEITLRYAKLKKAFLDNAIIVELGDVAKVTMSLVEVFSLMLQQPKREEGDLSIDELNIFYVPQQVEMILETKFSFTDAEGKTVIEEVKDSKYLFQIGDIWYVLRAVNVYWGGRGWRIDARSVGDPDGWGVGHQVFSHKDLS
ncbi:MAG: hypothetical protein ACD_58C00139G0002 [uncultured bacterium]|nr:MAG: hypothetical protein ACD_58C00139G0002 [uncultured bacterium]